MGIGQRRGVGCHHQQVFICTGREGQHHRIDTSRQIHDHRGHESVAVAGHNIKLGRGGIREIEFFVQTQQLIAGG
ncbi:MAG: hypothetical protein J0H30_14540, partial [Alphaproteobacteria bacterium]|nr:hypothetical protein [Alphaproteobacteria bacterium]